MAAPRKEGRQQISKQEVAAFHDHVGRITARAAVMRNPEEQRIDWNYQPTTTSNYTLAAPKAGTLSYSANTLTGR